MKANELMIGDWVYKDNTPVQILALNLFVGKEHEDIKPIPLTPEILEKNGFKHYHPENKKAEYWQLFTNGGDINVKKTYGFYRFRIYGKPIKPDAALPSFNGHLYNVHELQHALKLVGIDKEITI